MAKENLTAFMEKVLPQKDYQPTREDVREFRRLGVEAGKLDHETYEDIREFWSLRMGKNAAEAAREVRDLRIIHDLGRQPHTGREFIELFLNSRGYRQRLDGMYDCSPTPDGRTMLPESYVWDAIVEWTGDHGGGFRTDHLRATLNRYNTDTHRRMLKETADALVFDGNPRADQWHDLVTALLAPEKRADAGFVAACTIVLQTFVWRVKRQMNGQQETVHVMPYLFSQKQGTGKSRFSGWFLDPIGDGVYQAGFDLFGDRSMTGLLRTAPVIWFDEMANASKADANTVKRLMTAKHTVFRELYQKAGKDLVFSTFFGCGNFPLCDVIRDPSGTRRFFEMEVQNRIPVERFQRDYDAQGFWRSVDETAECPYLQGDNLALVEGFQMVQAQVHPVLQWFQTDYPPVRSWVRASNLWESFAEWERKHFSGLPTSQKAFGTILRTDLPKLGWTVEDKPSNGVHYFLTPPTSEGKPEDEPAGTPMPKSERGKVLALVRKQA